MIVSEGLILREMNAVELVEYYFLNIPLTKPFDEEKRQLFEKISRYYKQMTGKTLPLIPPKN